MNKKGWPQSPGRLKMRKLQTLLAAVCLLLSASLWGQKAKAVQHNVDISQRNPHEVPTFQAPKLRLAVGAGLMPTIFSSQSRAYGVLAARAQMRISDRASIGVAYAQGNTETKPYDHGEGTVSVMRTQLQNIGLRLQATAVQSGRFEFYGGVQLGITRPRDQVSYELSHLPDVGDPDAYFASLPSPYAPSRTSFGAAGFLGIQVEAIRHVHVYTEIGSSLAMIQSGLEFAF